MGWVFGIYYFHPAPVEKILPTFLPSSKHTTFQTSHQIIFAGGHSSTCMFAPKDETNQSDFSWLVLGTGLSFQNNEWKILTAEDWHELLSQKTFNANSIEGHFIAIRRTENGLECFSDRIGLRTLYYAEHDGKIFFSSRLDWVAASCGGCEINMERFGSRWTAMNLLSYDSTLKNIGRLAPGSTLQLSNKGCTQHHSSWNVSIETVDPDVSVNRISSLVKKLHQQYGTLHFGLSGGLDSRFLLSIMMNNHIPCKTYTFGPKEDPDAVIAKMIAQKYELPHEVINPALPDADVLINELQNYVAQTNCVESVLAGTRLRSYDPIISQEGIFIDGANGEFARMRFLSQLRLRGKSAFLQNNPKGVLPSISVHRASVFTSETAELMARGTSIDLQNALTTMNDVRDIDIDTQIDLFVMRYRIPNFGADEQTRVDVLMPNLMPFIQPSIASSLLSMRRSDKKNGRFVRKFIQAHTPELATLPLAKNICTIPFSFGTYSGIVWSQLQKKFGTVYHDPTPHLLLHTLQEWILDRINSTSVRTYKHYDQQKIDALVNGYFSGKHFRANEILWWVTFELWRDVVENKKIFDKQ